MLSIYKTDEDTLLSLERPEKGCWINLCDPTESEIEFVANELGFELDWVRAALDEEERARIEWDDGATLIIVDVPRVEAEGRSFVYSTIPLGILFNDEAIVTVTLIESPIINDFIKGRVKSFYTFKKTRFILQLLYKNATRFLMYLKQIDKASMAVQNELHKSMKNKELIQLLALEKSLVYFSTSLTSNEMVLDKMMKLGYIKKYQDDVDLLEDVIVENKQAIEMCNIYRDILSGTMDAFASVISNNLNIVMKLLAAITIIINIPALIASIWGMNVPLPLSGNKYGFWIILGVSAALSALIAYIMKKKKML